MNSRRKKLLSVVLCFALLIANASFAACGTQKLATTELFIDRTGAQPVTITVEIANTDETRQQGLMHRTSLPDGEGMLFVFDRDQILSFWMKDTLIPLSIAFIAYDGRIIEIKDMEPLDLNPVRSSRSVRYALEVPQGWFDRSGIKPGDVLRVDMIPSL